MKAEYRKKPELSVPGTDKILPVPVKYFRPKTNKKAAHSCTLANVFPHDRLSVVGPLSYCSGWGSQSATEIGSQSATVIWDFEKERGERMGGERDGVGGGRGYSFNGPQH